MKAKPIPVRSMYMLRDPDPLRQFSVRSIAEAAGCGKSIISALRSGKTSEVSEPIARGIAEAVDMPFDELFTPSGRTTWRGTPGIAQGKYREETQITRQAQQPE